MNVGRPVTWQSRQVARNTLCRRHAVADRITAVITAQGDCVVRPLDYEYRRRFAGRSLMAARGHPVDLGTTPPPSFMVLKAQALRPRMRPPLRRCHGFQSPCRSGLQYWVQLCRRCAFREESDRPSSKPRHAAISDRPVHPADEAAHENEPRLAVPSCHGSDATEQTPKPE